MIWTGAPPVTRAFLALTLSILAVRLALIRRFVTAIGLQAPGLAAQAPYDLIVANILAGPLVELADAFAVALRPGGRVLLSGLLAEQAAHILAAYAHRGFAFERRIDLETGGAWWRTLLLRKESQRFKSTP